MDVKRLASLIDRLGGPLELFARQWCDTPEDVVQEAFVKLAAGSTVPDQPAAWLFRVVRRSAINAGKASTRRRRHEDQAGREPRAWFESDSGAIDPEDVADALRTLPVDLRAVIVARLWGGLTFEEVARVVGGSSSGAHRLYHEGLQTLRAQLGVAWKPTTKR